MFNYIKKTLYEGFLFTNLIKYINYNLSFNHTYTAKLP